MATTQLSLWALAQRAAELTDLDLGMSLSDLAKSWEVTPERLSLAAETHWEFKNGQYTFPIVLINQPKEGE